MNKIFGWDYPAGAENDRNAPYNEKEPPEFITANSGFCTRCDETHDELNEDFLCEDCFQRTLEED